jgi:hypothetical protein
MATYLFPPSVWGLRCQPPDHLVNPFWAKPYDGFVVCRIDYQWHGIAMIFFNYFLAFIAFKMYRPKLDSLFMQVLLGLVTRRAKWSGYDYQHGYRPFLVMA